MTDTNTEAKALSVLLRTHCGIEGESVGEFMGQIKKLTAKDREAFRSMFEAQGIHVKPEAFKA